jgi:hypothetical protein
MFKIQLIDGVTKMTIGNEEKYSIQTFSDTGKKVEKDE